MSILDHLTLTVADLPASRALFERALAPLGITVLQDFGTEVPWGPAVAFGRNGQSSFWLTTGDHPQAPMHLAFTAEDRAQVDAFHAAALEAGATDNGGPGLRAHYHPHYYGAFVLDASGHNLEAVCHQPAE